MRRICAGLATFALVAAGLATVTGFLAPWWAVADMPNHFVPLVLAAAIAGLILLPFGAHALAAHPYARAAIGLGLAGIAAINAVPLIAAPASAPEATERRGHAGTLTVVSFNVLTKNRRIDEIGRWLTGQNADVVVLQEMTHAAREPMRRALAAAYPYVHDCGCNDIVIYTRRPGVDAGGQARTPGQPPLTWVTIGDRAGRDVQVVGLHPRYNLVPSTYAAHYDWLVRNLPKFGDRVIVAGDFNATPWSWQMQRLVAATGLRRHGTYAASWPSPLPMLLIDNLLTTPGIEAVSFRTGPYLGSDHLPVVATVGLP
jgi:endonuclease/exonuclease/phosphatase (EEP) superfamily protein YafD